MASIFKRFTNDNGKYLVDKIKGLLNLKQDKLTKGEGIEINDNNVISSTVINDTLETGTKNTYSISKLKSMIGSPLRYRSNVATVADLSAIADKTVGDVYSVTENQSTYACDKDLNWIAIGTTDVDMGGFYTKQEVDDLLEDKEDSFVVGEGLDNSTTDTSGKPIIKANIIKDDASETEEKKTYSVKKLNDDYLKKVKNTSNIVYINDVNSTPSYMYYSNGVDVSTIVQRDVNGDVKVNDTPSANTSAISLNTLDRNRLYKTINNNGTSLAVEYSVGVPSNRGALSADRFYSNGLNIVNAQSETAGIHLNNKEIVMWTPCNSSGCISYYDEDTDGSTPVFRIKSDGMYRSAGRCDSDLWVSAKDGWSITSQDTQVCGSFLMFSITGSNTETISVNGSSTVQIFKLKSTAYNCQTRRCACSLVVNAGWDGGSPFRAYMYGTYLYIINTNINQKNWGSNTFHISGCVPLESTPW